MVAEFTFAGADMRRPTSIRPTAVIVALTVLVALAVAPHALADPDGSVDSPTAPLEQAAGEVNEMPSSTSTFNVEAVNPSNGSTVGVAKPIVITFTEPITDRAVAEDTIHISSDPPVAGKFYWMNDSQVRWRPFEFWPEHASSEHRCGGHHVQLHHR